MKKILYMLCMLMLSTTALADNLNNPKVEMQTNQGIITIELYADQAPITVRNFLSYVDNGFYQGTQFHRVIGGFMIQGGGFTADMVQKETMAPIKNESSNGLSNQRGTIAMARTRVPDSATSQFFINLVNNRNLDFAGRPGYAVFGRVVKGMDIVDSISRLRTGSRGHHRDVPLTPVVISEIKVIK